MIEELIITYDTDDKEYDGGIPILKRQELVRCKDCVHRDPEDMKCDCGGLERQGCDFRVDDDYFCKYGERESNGTLDASR